MKDFYEEHEPIEIDWTDEQIRIQKRKKVLEVIRPICKAFEIKDFDYVIDETHERLVLESQEIGRMNNSIGATVDELINYIWLKTVAKNKEIFSKNIVVDGLKKFWLRGSRK